MEDENLEKIIKKYGLDENVGQELKKISGKLNNNDYEYCIDIYKISKIAEIKNKDYEHCQILYRMKNNVGIPNYPDCETVLKYVLTYGNDDLTNYRVLKIQRELSLTDLDYPLVKRVADISKILTADYKYSMDLALIQRTLKVDLDTAIKIYKIGYIINEPKNHERCLLILQISKEITEEDLGFCETILSVSEALGKNKNYQHCVDVYYTFMFIDNLKDYKDASEYIKKNGKPSIF
jgi:hypothetical protein